MLGWDGIWNDQEKPRKAPRPGKAHLEVERALKQSSQQAQGTTVKNPVGAEGREGQCKGTWGGRGATEPLASGRQGAALHVLKGTTSTLKSCTPFIRPGEGRGHHECPHFLPETVVLTERKLARSWLPQPVVGPSGHVAHVAAEGEGWAVTPQSRFDVGSLCSTPIG